MSELRVTSDQDEWAVGSGQWAAFAIRSTLYAFTFHVSRFTPCLFLVLGRSAHLADRSGDQVRLYLVDAVAGLLGNNQLAAWRLVGVVRLEFDPKLLDGGADLRVVKGEGHAVAQHDQRHIGQRPGRPRLRIALQDIL